MIQEDLALLFFHVRVTSITSDSVVFAAAGSTPFANAGDSDARSNRNNGFPDGFLVQVSR